MEKGKIKKGKEEKEGKGKENGKRKKVPQILNILS